MTVNPIQLKITKYKPFLGLSNWVQGIFLISGIISAISLFSKFLQSQLINKVINGGYVSLAEAEANDNRELVIGYIHLVIVLIGLILFLMWVYRTNKNLHSFNYPVLEFTPGWSVGWFFIPIACLFQPYRAVSEISRASNPNIDSTLEPIKNIPTPFIVVLWWVFFLITNIVARIASRFITDDSTARELLNVTYAYMVSDTIDIIGIAITIMMIRAISNSQQLRYQNYTKLQIQQQEVSHGQQGTQERQETQGRR